jgi:hypothetical protein
MTVFLQWATLQVLEDYLDFDNHASLNSSFLRRAQSKQKFMSISESTIEHRMKTWAEKKANGLVSIPKRVSNIRSLGDYSGYAQHKSSPTPLTV